MIRNIDTASLNDREFEIFVSKYNKIIKEKSFYTDYITGKRCHASLKDLLFWYGGYFDSLDNGKFRNKDKTGYLDEADLSAYQKLWYDDLSKYNPTYFITIKLPHANKEGLKRTRNHEEAKKMYRQILREFEYYFVGSNRWKKEPLKIKGVMESGKKGFYHLHLFVIDWEPTWSYRLNDRLVTKLDMAAADVIRKHKFYKTVFKIQRVYHKPGLLAYMCKKLKDTTAEEEKNYVFDLKTWFNIDWEDSTPENKEKVYEEKANIETNQQETNNIQPIINIYIIHINNMSVMSGFINKLKNMWRNVSYRLMWLSAKLLHLINIDTA